MALASLAMVKPPEAISVDFDATFLVQVAMFVALTLFLKPVLFEPLLELFEERERRIDGAKLQARKIDEKSATAQTKYEAEMAKARSSAGAERDKIRGEAQKQEQEILAKVRASAAAVIDAGKRGAAAEAESARTNLKLEAAARARELASRVLGREVQS